VASSDRHRQDSQPAYVLHTYPFRETSLVVEVFSRHFGRLGLVARGARRPRSAVRGLMMAFQPLLLSWAGKAELRTLHKAEWQGGMPQLKGPALVCGFYLNELLLKFLAREDAHEALFDVYHEAIAGLAQERPAEAILRRFEKSLLKELGYALSLDREGTGQPVDPAGRYTYVVDRGPVAVGARDDVPVEITGRALLDLACDNFTEATTLAQAKLLMRYLLNHHLGNQELHTRLLLRELNQL
jgi:DNA repair protein RecO (recombination protein O)